MFNGVATQGLVWGSYEAVLQPLVPLRRGLPLDSGMPGEERSGKRKCWNCMTSGMLEEERSP